MQNCSPNAKLHEPRTVFPGLLAEICGGRPVMILQSSHCSWYQLYRCICLQQVPERAILGRSHNYASVFQGDELSSNEMLFHCVPHQFGITLRAKDIHNPVFMEGYSSGRQIQGVSNFLHDFSFG